MTRQFSLYRPAAAAALIAALVPGAYAAGGARVDFAVGNVVALAPSGEARALAKGAAVASGETVRTDAGARAQLRFDDGALVSLQPQTDFRLDDYHYAGRADGQERGFFSLLKGGLRTITGLIGRGNRDAYKVTTSVATIGIRGTEYTLAYSGADRLAVATGEGTIEVCNGAGCALLTSGESAVIAGPAAPLQREALRPQLPPPQPVEVLVPAFSSSERRNPDGSVQPGAVLPETTRSKPAGTTPNGTVTVPTTKQTIQTTLPGAVRSPGANLSAGI